MVSRQPDDSPPDDGDAAEALRLLIWLSQLARDVRRRDAVACGLPELLDPPRTIGRYRLEALLGTGGFGAVFRAVDTHLARVVALKLAWPSVLMDPEASRRFVDEPRTMASLHHPGIVEIYDSGDFDVGCYIALELIHGPTLAQWLHGHGRAPCRLTASIMSRVAESVQAAHAHGVLHRDLKPSNILLRPRDGDPEFGYEPVVTDFGLAARARGAEASFVTHTGTAFGTEFYMSPEQAAGKMDDVKEPSDIFSLGVMLYELITGRRPFEGETADQTRQMIVNEEPRAIRGIRPDVPSDLETIVLKCLEKSPSDRYTSAQGLAADLDRFLGNEPIDATRASLFRRGVKYAQRKPQTVALLLSTVLGILALSAIVVAWTLDRVEAGKRLAASEAAAAVAETMEREHEYAANIQQAAAALHRSGRREVLALLEECQTIALPPLRCGVEWDFLRTEADRADVTLHAHPTGVHSVRFSPAGDVVASGGKDGRVCMWETEGWTKKCELRFADNDEVSALEFSADGSLLAVAGETGRMAVYRLSDARVVFEERLNEGRIFALAWIGTSHEIALGGDTGVLSVVDIDTGAYRRQSLSPSETGRQAAPGHPVEIIELSYIAADQKLAVFLDPPSTFLVDPATLDEQRLWNDGQTSIRNRCYVPMGQGYVASIDTQEGLRLRNVTDGSLAGSGHLPAGVRSLRYSPKGALLATGRDGAVYVYRVDDLLQGRPAKIRRLLGHVGQTVDVDTSPDGQWLCSGGVDGDLKIWRAPLDYDFCDAPLAAEPVLTRFSPCGRWLAVVQTLDGTTGRLDLVDAHTGRVRWREEITLIEEIEALTDPAYYCAFDPSGDEFAVFENNHTVRLFSTSDGQKQRVISGNFGNRVVALQFSADGRWLILRRAYDNALVLDRQTGKVVQEVTVAHLAILHTWAGDLWFELTPDRRPLLHGLHGEPPVLVLDQLPERVRVITASPDGRYLAMSGAESIVYLADLRNPGPLAKLVGHEGAASETCFSPDSRTLISLGDDGTVRFWHIPTRSELLKIGSPDMRALTMGFHPSGKLLVVGVEHEGRYGLQIFRLDAERSLLKDFDPTSLDDG